MSKREQDLNGYITIKSNPITREGVFPYLGNQIGAPEPDKVYMVYRPEEEINNPETIESFKLIPLVDDHTMIGNTDEGFTPAEEKGVHGSTGERIEFKDGVLYSSLRIFSEKLKGLIEKGKKDLSLGYRCQYEKSSGTFAGKAYDYIQRSIRGNHLALVDQARCDVSVMDAHFAYDNLDLNIKKENKMNPQDKNKKVVDDKTKEGEDAITLEELAATVEKLAAAVEALTNKSGDEEVTTETAATPNEGDAAKLDSAAEKVDSAKEDVAATNAPAKQTLEQKLESVETSIEEVKSKVETGMDAALMRKSIMQEIAARDALAKDLSNHVGVFDHADKSLAEVAAYGVKKLNLEAKKGEELPTLRGYLKASQSTQMAADSAVAKKSSGFNFRDTMTADKK